MLIPLHLQVAYGTTENSPVTFMGFPNDSITRKTETVGCIFPHTEVTTLSICSKFSACSRPWLSSLSGVGVSAGHHVWLRHDTPLSLCSLPLQAKIEDPETGQPVPLNTTGELQIRGYCVMLGYWDDPAKTNEVVTAEGWYRTG